jgi:hypothetical protein
MADELNVHRRVFRGGVRNLVGVGKERSKESAFSFKYEKKQILRSPTPATAKAAVAGDPGFAQDDTHEVS